MAMPGPPLSAPGDQSIVSVAIADSGPHVADQRLFKMFRRRARRAAFLSGAEKQMNPDERNEGEEAAERTEAAGAESGRDDRRGEDHGPDNGANPEGEAPYASGRDDDDRSGESPGGESEELARTREAMLRLKAEMDNREKRLEREMAKSRKFALESLMRDLVQVLDSMDQALSSADAENARAAYEGLELTRKQALQVLTSHGLEVLDPLGERFDPSWHEAIATQPSDEFEPDTVAQVLQKGYRLNERLIRPARVIVASAG